MSPDLGRGANTSLSGAPLDVAVTGARQGTVDLMVFQLTAAGTVRSDADFVFFNQPASPEGGVRLTAPDRLAIDPSRVPAAIERLAVAVTLDDAAPGSLAGIPGLAVVTADGGTSIAAPSVGLTSERSAVLIEITGARAPGRSATSRPGGTVDSPIWSASTGLSSTTRRRRHRPPPRRPPPHRRYRPRRRPRHPPAASVRSPARRSSPWRSDAPSTCARSRCTRSC